jgi:hypothetical protein
MRIAVCTYTVWVTICAAGALGTLGGCFKHVVPVIPDGPTHGAGPAAADPTFEVVARIAGAKDPLPVSGADIAYSDLETALDLAVLRAVPPRHDNILTVELVAADAVFANTRLTVSLVVRATLRTRVGDAFVAQREFICRDGAILAPEAGARVVWSCMTRLGQDLGGWLADMSQTGGSP